MTREEALKELFSTRGIYKNLGVTRVAVAAWKRRLKEGNYLLKSSRKY